MLVKRRRGLASCTGGEHTLATAVSMSRILNKEDLEPRQEPEEKIVSLLPPNDMDTDYEQLHTVIAAQRDCEVLGGDNEVAVLEDAELGQVCVEVTGTQAGLHFACDSILQHLVLHLKNVGKFVRFEIEVIDDSRQYRIFKASNTASMAHVDQRQGEACLPLQLAEGWNHLSLDLERLTRQAFGTTFLSCVAVRVFANCRLLRAYFQDRPYADAELPEHLQVLPVTAEMVQQASATQST